MSFVISVKYGHKNDLPGYMKGFYWYPLVALIILIPTYIMARFANGVDPWGKLLLNLSIIFHYTFLSLFVLRVIPSSANNIIYKIVFYIFLSLILIVLVINDYSKNNFDAYSIANFGLLIFCLFYYFNIFNNIPDLNLLNDASFWIITGVFFAMSVHLPSFFFMSYLYDKIFMDSYRPLMSIPRICYGIMHLFFIKAYLCAIRPQKA